MSRYVKNSDRESDAKAGYRTCGIVSTETVDFPLRRSSRVKSAGKKNKSSPESSLSNISDASYTPIARNKRRRVDSLNNSTVTERSRTVHLRRNRRNVSGNDQVNKSDDQTSGRLTRAGSESKSPQIVTRPVRRTRASSMEPEAVKKKNVVETTNSGLAYKSVTMRKQRSKILKTIVIEEDEEKMFPFVALDRMLPNLKGINETYSGNSTTETLNKSISISKETLNSSSENTSKEEPEADGNAKNEHATPVERPSAETVQENEMGMSINQNTLTDISKKSRSDSTHTITQMKTSTPDVPKTQSSISTKVTSRKLLQKNESSTKEEDGHLNNKENRASNIIEDPKSNDLTVSNILSQSPQPLIILSAVSDVCTERSVKEDDEDMDSSDNIEVCEDLSSDENINDTHTDKSNVTRHNKEKQIQLITLGDETITIDENDEMLFILEAEETVNVDKEDPKEVCLTQIATADAKCEGINQAGVSKKPGNLNESFDETTTTNLQETEMSTDDTSINDLQETEAAAKVPSHESIMKEPFDVHTKSNNFELANENENNITNVIENSHSPNVAQSLVGPINKPSEKVDVTQNTSTVDNCLPSEEKSIIGVNSQNDIEKNEIPETVRKQKEKMQVDDDLSDAHTDTDLLQDIPADEWEERNSDKDFVHSMSTEKLEYESENECDDFVLVDKEISPIAENIEKEKESSDCDSDDTVILKAQRNSLIEKTVERMDMSESQCETNESKSAMVKDAQQSMQQEEIIAAEANSENEEEHVENQTEEVQNAENVSTRTSTTNEVSKQSPLESDDCIEKSADTNSTNEIYQTLDTESPLNKRKSQSRLSEDGSNGRKSVCKSVEKSDSEVEEPSEVDAVDEKDSLSKSPIGSPSDVSDSNKTDESMDSDIEREYNLNGVEVCKFSDDDVPGDECRASETGSSDPDDNGSDLADFVVNDDDEISEEVESSELDGESSTGQRGKMQMQDESDEKRMKNGEKNGIDRGISGKEKSKSKKSEKLGLDKITESDEKITNSEIETIDKKKKREKMKRCVEEEQIDEKELRIYEEEIAEKVTKKGQRRRGAEEYVEGIENEYIDTPKKKQSKLRKTTKLDLSGTSESGKNVKRKSEIETGNRIRKITAEDNGSRMRKENAVPTSKKYETPTVKSSKMEVSRKRIRNHLEDVSSSSSEFTVCKSKKRKLNPEDLTSRSIRGSVLERSDVNVMQDLCLLSLYGSTTNFYVTNIQKLKKKKNASEIQLYRQRMLNRRARLLNYTMFLGKQ